MLPARRQEISRLEGFSDAVFAFAIVSVSAGALATAIAQLGPTRLAALSGFTCFLMGPAKFAYGWTMGRRRSGFEARLRHAATRPSEGSA